LLSHQGLDLLNAEAQNARRLSQTAYDAGYSDGQQRDRNKSIARLLMSEYIGRNALSEVLIIGDEPLVGGEPA
jgi:hypothetical protein